MGGNMESTLKNINVIIVAKNHNPSIISKDWLAHKKILLDPVEGFFHNPAISVIKTKYLEVLVDLERLKISPRELNDENIERTSKFVEAYINALPEIPYKAIGFNYDYEINLPYERLKTIFCKDENKFNNVFSSDYTVGGIITFQKGSFIVTVTIKPTQKIIAANFNFHLDWNDMAIDKIKEIMETTIIAEKILERMLNEKYDT